MTWDAVAQEMDHDVEAEQSDVLDGRDSTQADKNTSDSWGIIKYIETRRRLNDAPIDPRYLSDKEDYNPFLGYRLKIDTVFPYHATMTLEDAAKRMFAEHNLDFEDAKNIKGMLIHSTSTEPDPVMQQIMPRYCSGESYVRVTSEAIEVKVVELARTLSRLLKSTATPTPPCRDDAEFRLDVASYEDARKSAAALVARSIMHCHPDVCVQLRRAFLPPYTREKPNR